MAPSGYGLKSSFCSVGKEVIFGEYFILQNIFQIQITDRTKETIFFLSGIISLSLLAIQTKKIR